MTPEEENMSEGPEDIVARTQISGHIDVCTERYGNLWQAVSEMKRDIQMLSGRLFMIVLGSAGAGFLAMAALVFWEITAKGH